MSDLLKNNPIAKFAADNYVLGADSAISGKYHIENSPFHADVFRALHNPQYREVTCRFASQLGKNLISEIWTGYVIAHAPGNMLVNGQTDEDIELFVRDRLFKRLANLDCLTPVWPYKKGDFPKGGELHLAHMYVLALGANLANLQGKSARYILNDEVHLWKPGMLDNARDRCSAFWDAKMLNISTAGDDESDEAHAFEQGSQDSWHLGCPECKKKVRLMGKWSGGKERVIVWESDDVTKPKNKKWNWQELRKTIKFKCPYCQADFDDSLQNRIEMNRLGGYISLNPNAAPDKKSFHCSQVAAPWVTWEELVERWIKSVERLRTGDVSLLKNFVIKRLAETWEDQTPSGSNAIITGGYAIKEDFQWEKEAQRFLAVDVQERGGRHFWAVARAWAQFGESRLIRPERLVGWADIDQMAKDLRIPANKVCVDARYATNEVIENCARYGWTWMQADESKDGKRKFYAHKSDETENNIMRPFSQLVSRDPGIGTRNQARKLAYGCHFSKDWVRDSIQRRILGEGIEWGLPDDIEDLTWEGTNTKQTNYLDQLNSWMCAEKTDPQTNKVKKIWKMIRRDDHLRACEEMQLIMAAGQNLIPSEVDSSES